MARRSAGPSPRGAQVLGDPPSTATRTASDHLANERDFGGADGPLAVAQQDVPPLYVPEAAIERERVASALRADSAPPGQGVRRERVAIPMGKSERRARRGVAGAWML